MTLFWLTGQVAVGGGVFFAQQQKMFLVGVDTNPLVKPIVVFGGRAPLFL